MNVLSIVHGEDAGAELFGPLVVEAGHRLDEWSFGWETPPPQPLDSYDAVLVFGGAMHPDQDGLHPWLRDESEWIGALSERQVPTLGICLGSELLAQAAGACVGRLADPEVGWFEVELTDAGLADPVLSALPQRFAALQWHHYGSELPDGAVALAENAASLQAFRLGAACWGVQFHPEVTEPQLGRWIADESDPASDPDRLLRETRERIGTWNELGRRLCRSFLSTAERLVSNAG
jgi:GMP synthase-like glutamine amidotransferase